MNCNATFYGNTYYNFDDWATQTRSRTFVEVLEVSGGFMSMFNAYLDT